MPPKGAQESLGEPRRVQESPGGSKRDQEFRRVQESSGEARRAQDSASESRRSQESRRRCHHRRRRRRSVPDILERNATKNETKGKPYADPTSGNKKGVSSQVKAAVAKQKYVLDRKQYYTLELL